MVFVVRHILRDAAKRPLLRMTAVYVATLATVIPAKAGIQYALYSRFLHRRSGILDPPLEPVIGLAEGETR
jgi:hypothetical protein